MGKGETLKPRYFHFSISLTYDENLCKSSSASLGYFLQKVAYLSILWLSPSSNLNLRWPFWNLCFLFMRSRVVQQSFAEAPSWVVLRMAQNRDCYSSIAECEGCKRWKFRVVIMCVLVGIVGFFLGLEGSCGVWGGERLEREVLWERRAQVMVQEFNLSKTQLQALTFLLSSSEVNNQHKFTILLSLSWGFFFAPSLLSLVFH